VDEEEKNSLDNCQKIDSVSEIKTFRLHCFPEISNNRLSEIRNPRNDKAQFKECSIEHLGQTGIQGLGHRQAAETSDHDMPAQELHSQIFDEGYQKGFQDGLKSERQKIDQAIITLHRIFEEVSQLRQKLCNEAETAIVSLSLAIARKLLQREIEINPNSILSIVRSALKNVVDSANVKIKANPSDIETIENHKGEFLELLGKDSGIKIESDGTIQAGGCLIETRFGDIDARLDEQYKLIERAFKKELSDLAVNPAKELK
jgi:flagellar assembly protein FliH